MSTYIWVKKGYGNDLVPDNTKPLYMNQYWDDINEPPCHLTDNNFIKYSRYQSANDLMKFHSRREQKK